MSPSCKCSVDHESLLLQNCRAFLGSPEADYDIGTRLDDNGQWHAFVLKTEDGKRSKVLTSTASHLVGAIEILHENSARAVHQHITCHSYDLPPSTSTKSRSGLRGGEVRPEVIALCSSSDTEASASDSDDSVDETTTRVSHRRSHRHEAVNGRRPRPSVQRANDQAAERRPPTWGPIPQRPAVIQNPSPPPGWNPPMPVPAPVPAPVQSIRPPPGVGLPPGVSLPPGVAPPAGAVPPPARAVPLPPPGQKTHAALLNINWPGNGKKNMLVQVAPSIQFLQHIATNEAVLHPSSFASPSNPMPYPPVIRNNTSYRATVRRVTLGEETYEMTAFGNDLTALFRSTPAIPKFDIDIITSNIYFPVVPPPRPTSAASTASSCIVD
ncbi:hypothetical protein FALBO_1422 [Fusarium albosuccineum]|uniref:Uncharacterized protein n=1 Tax=Fusarium albosuccineum TaxID=1237068 RepID=A0A8H4LL95_9HYPO|nr:hypothetical protein FALBO_1422 [Fusarium albosuccineum]